MSSLFIKVEKSELDSDPGNTILVCSDAKEVPSSTAMETVEHIGVVESSTLTEFNIQCEPVISSQSNDRDSVEIAEIGESVVNEIVSSPNLSLIQQSSEDVLSDNQEEEDILVIDEGGTMVQPSEFENENVGDFESSDVAVKVADNVSFAECVLSLDTNSTAKNFKEVKEESKSEFQQDIVKEEPDAFPWKAEIEDASYLSGEDTTEAKLELVGAVNNNSSSSENVEAMTKPKNQVLSSPMKEVNRVHQNDETDRLGRFLNRRPRRITILPNMRLNKNEGPNHGLRLTKFNGMGVVDILQRVADRGHIMYVDGVPKWVAPQSLMEPKLDVEEDEVDMTIGGVLDVYSPMKVCHVNSPKWRYRRKKPEDKKSNSDSTPESGIGLTKVDPSSVVPSSVSGSLGSTGSISETELGTDDDEDEGELAPQGWIVTKGPDPSISSSTPAQEVEYELIEEPEYLVEDEPASGCPPPKKRRKQKHVPQPHSDGKIYPKPTFSYSCLIAMSLKNSIRGCLPVSEIYKFMCDHFPYFKTAPSGWKNSVRHNLSLNKCFEKIEKPGSVAKKGCLWGFNSTKITKMDEEVQKFLRKDPASIILAMSDPENLELIERGELKRDYSIAGGASDEEVEEEEEAACNNREAASVAPVRERLTPVGRISRQNSIEGIVVGSGGKEKVITVPPGVTISQIFQQPQHQPLRAIVEPLVKVKTEPTVSNSKIKVGGKVEQRNEKLPPGVTPKLDLQLSNVQANYLCTSNNGTFTLTLGGLSHPVATTPLIIRRTTVK